jgi:hypothetical protein
LGGAGGAGGVPLDSCASLQDSFEGASLDPQWNQSRYGGASMLVSDGQLVVRFPAQAVTYAGAFIGSASRYDLTDSHVSIKVAQLPDPAPGAVGFLRASVDDDNYIEFFMENNELIAGKHMDGEAIGLTFLPYDPAEHVFWRLRETSGRVYWETSRDARRWEIAVVESDPMPLSSVTIELGAGSGADTPSPKNALFDDLNALP